MQMLTIGPGNSEHEKELTLDYLKALSEILKIDLDISRANSFLKLNHGNANFYSYFHEELMFDELRDNSACAISIDWRWNPEDLFCFLSYPIPEHALELSTHSLNEEDETYDLTFKMDGSSHKMIVDISEPSKIVRTINERLKDKQFIETVFGEDSYSWILAPKPFDIGAFSSLTGYLEVQEEPEEMIINPKCAQAEKILFLPQTTYSHKGQKYMLMYKSKLDKELVRWTGAVLPGQTLEEGIATELAHELSYSGDFAYDDLEFGGYEKDKAGQKVKLFCIKLALLGELTTYTTESGLEIVRVKVSGV